MSKLKFTLLALVLSFSEGLKLTNSKLFGGEKGIFLKETDLEKIEKELQLKKQLEENNSAIETFINESSDELEVSGEDLNEKITAIVDLARKYNQSSAAEPTQTFGKKDPVVSNEEYYETSIIFEKIKNK